MVTQVATTLLGINQGCRETFYRREATLGSKDYRRLGLRVRGGMVRPCSESLMSVASRFSLVSSLFAPMTHQMAARRYQEGRD